MIDDKYGIGYAVLGLAVITGLVAWYGVFRFIRWMIP